MDAFGERGRSLNRNASACGAGGFVAPTGHRALGRGQIDAGMIARFMAFRPEAGCSLPHEKLRGFRSSETWRAQAVDSLKRHSLHCSAIGRRVGMAAARRRGAGCAPNRPAGRRGTMPTVEISCGRVAANQSECSLNAGAINPAFRFQSGRSRRQAIQRDDRKSSVLV